MEITQEYQLLIQDIVKHNNRFAGNEDLFDDFCSETVKRSYKIISSINNINNLEGYLQKVATTAILEVLKSSGRLRRSASGYVKTAVTLNVSVEASNDNYLENIPDPAADFEDSIISKESLNNVLKQLYVLDAQEKDKNFLTLFELRYIKNLKQAEIAEEMGISQSEVSKRLIEIAQKTISFI